MLQQSVSFAQEFGELDAAQPRVPVDILSVRGVVAKSQAVDSPEVLRETLRHGIDCLFRGAVRRDRLHLNKPL